MQETSILLGIFGMVLASPVLFVEEGRERAVGAFHW
jgi:hypothetical protein